MQAKTVVWFGFKVDGWTGFKELFRRFPDRAVLGEIMDGSEVSFEEFKFRAFLNHLDDPVGFGIELLSGECGEDAKEVLPGSWNYMAEAVARRLNGVLNGIGISAEPKFWIATFSPKREED
jgi:hypothetical protein